MEKSIPPKLYKYQSLSDNSYTLENLRNHHIWFSKPDRLNDPYDFLIPFRYPRSHKEYQELYDKLVQLYKESGENDKIKEMEIQFLTKGKINKKFKDDIKNAHLQKNQKKIDQFRQMGVASFSEKQNNILMWSHYADSHKGICLEFDTSYFPFQDHEKLHQIIYSNSYPLISPAEPFRLKNFPVDPLITKSKSWRYEKEWRSIKERGDSAIEYDPKALTAIYFGCFMPLEQGMKIVFMLAKSAPLYFQMTLSDSKFELIPVPYSH